VLVAWRLYCWDSRAGGDAGRSRGSVGGLLLGYTLRLGMHAEQLGDWWGLESKHGHHRQILQHGERSRAPTNVEPCMSCYSTLVRVRVVLSTSPA
jgi:hypothetical protein